MYRMHAGGMPIINLTLSCPMSPTTYRQNSDSVRHSRPLAHVQTLTLPEQPFRLTSGSTLPEVVVAYETYGQLAKTRENAVLVCHAISGDSHVARHDEKDDPGWWDLLVGPGHAIDTNQFFVICTNVLGGCRGTTGPNSINPETRKPYGLDFPTVTVEDMVKVQVALLNELGIEQLHGVIGGSLGGHQALSWAALHGHRVKCVAALATSPRLTSQGVAFDVVARNAIQQDPNFADGRYYDQQHGPDVGLAIARMLGHITYLSPEGMSERFDDSRVEARGDEQSDFERKFSVGSYLAHQGERFVERFDANSYLTLSMAMDLFDMGGDQETLSKTLENSDCRWLVVSFSSDWLFPPSQSQSIVRALISNKSPVSYCNIITPCGHDAFLLQRDLPLYGELVKGLLGPDKLKPRELEEDRSSSTTRLFRQRRDYDHLINLIPDGSSVLDLGCGNGGLLARLREKGHSHVVGIDLSPTAIVECTRLGLPAIQSDLDDGLDFFPNNHFDIVVLSQTLQAVRDVDRVLSELLRVGQRALVSFPNAAYAEHRRHLADFGQIPDMALPESHRWHDSPPLRLFSIRDFEVFCENKNIAIHELVALNEKKGGQVHKDPNLNADLAIFVISRRTASP